MRGLLVGPAIAAAVLLPAAPATTGTTLSAADRAAVVAVPSPRPVLPDLPHVPGEGCTVPVGTLEACPWPDQRQPPVSCVLPVQGPGVLVPDCPRRDSSPEGRVVPVLPLTR